MTASVASAAVANLAQSGARILARIRDSDHATDLAIGLSSARLAVLRCVEQATPEDHTALATMVSVGDFVWAGLVYSTQLEEDWPGRVEAFHVSELPRLIQRLQGLQRPAP